MSEDTKNSKISWLINNTSIVIPVAVIIVLMAGLYLSIRQSSEECVLEGFEEIQEKSKEVYGDNKTGSSQENTSEGGSGFEPLYDPEDPEQLTSALRTWVESRELSDFSSYDDEVRAQYYASRALLDDCGVDYKR